MPNQKPSRIDKDSIILSAFGKLGGNVSPRELSRECQKQGLSRSSYFRRLKKLKKRMLVEENLLRIDDERTRKVYNRVLERDLADSRGIEQYLKEMESSDKDIRSRGFRDFDRMCENKRTAWYFSYEHNPKFKDKEAVKDFFEKRLVHDSEKWLRLLNNIVSMETKGSLWKDNLHECCREILWRISWKSEDFRARNKSIQILRRFPETRQDTLRWTFHVIEEDSKDEDFANLRDLIRSILFDLEGKDRKYLIREKLNELSLQSEKLRKRTNYILKNVPF